MTIVAINNYESPLGNIVISTTEKGICDLSFTTNKATPLQNNHLHIQQCIADLEAYFQGTLTNFRVSLDYGNSGTDFQKEVWKELINIPIGKKWTYGQLAKTLNRPKASRAVGAACGKNKIAIIIPCHRVIGSNKKLTGYASGLDKKRWLLAHEMKHNSQQKEILHLF